MTLIQAPYYDVGDPAQQTRLWLVQHHLRESLGEPLIRAADRQSRWDTVGRAELVTQIVEGLAQLEPQLLAEMLVAQCWETAQERAKADGRYFDAEFGRIAEREIANHEGRHRGPDPWRGPWPDREQS